MSFALSLQSAPEWRGDWVSPPGWLTGTSQPVITGRFSGKVSGKYSLTPLETGTIGATTVLTVQWAFTPSNGSASETGRLDIGTNSGYFVNKKILFHGDLMIHFPIGGLVAGELIEFNVTAARRLPRSFYRIAGTANPADVALVTGGRSTSDALFVSDAGDVSVLRKRRGHSPTVQVVFQDNASKRQIEHMEGSRQALMLGEHYDRDTVFLLRGGGLEPLIGSMFGTGTNGVRASAGTSWDHRSGQYRRALSNQARTSPGVQFESNGGAGPYERNFIPLRYKHIGSALRVSSVATTNLLPNSHPQPLVFGWNVVSGPPTLTFEHGMLGVLDPDETSWPDGFTRGVLKVHFDVGEIIASDLAVVANSTKYMCTIWTRGRGNLVYEVFGGAGAATTLRATFTLPTNFKTETDWQRLEVEVTTGASDTRLALRVRSSSGDALCYLSAASVVRSDHMQASTYEPTTASTGQRTAETYTIVDPLPEQAGTIQFWFQDTGDNQSSTFSLVESLTDGRFALRVNTAGADSIQFHTDTGGGNELTATIPNGLKIHEWRHVAATWTNSSSNLLTRTLYMDGVQIGSPTSAAMAEVWGPLSIFPTVGGVTANDWCIQELRIDRRALTAAEILDSYQRFTLDSWIHVQRLYAGREFRIATIADRWRHPQRPDVLIADVSLLESGVHESSLVSDP